MYSTCVVFSLSFTVFLVLVLLISSANLPYDLQHAHLGSVPQGQNPGFLPESGPWRLCFCVKWILRLRLFLKMCPQTLHFDWVRSGVVLMLRSWGARATGWAGSPLLGGCNTFACKYLCQISAFPVCNNWRSLKTVLAPERCVQYLLVFFQYTL